ncbi:MAG: molybdate ABC transporter substrate-binding protein [Actinomycetota bacterium]
MRLAVALIAAVVVLGGCGASGGDDETLLVFAAASLSDVLPPLAERFEAERGVEVELVFAGSSALRAQLLDGAPADVFISADRQTMDAAVDGGAIDGAPEIVARNRLAVVVPAGNPGGLGSVGDLARDELLVGLCAPSVPCGSLARAALDAAGVLASPDTEEPDVRSLLAKVVVGELDAAVVYRTDLLAAGDALESVAFDHGPEGEAVYPAGVVRDGDADDAARFIASLLDADGRARFASLGFVEP